MLLLKWHSKWIKCYNYCSCVCQVAPSAAPVPLPMSLHFLGSLSGNAMKFKTSSSHSSFNMTCTLLGDQLNSLQIILMWPSFLGRLPTELAKWAISLIDNNDPIIVIKRFRAAFDNSVRRVTVNQKIHRLYQGKHKVWENTAEFPMYVGYIGQNNLILTD